MAEINQNPLRAALVSISNKYLEPLINGEIYTLPPDTLRKVEICAEIIKAIDMEAKTNDNPPR